MKKFAGYFALFFLVAALPVAKVWSQTKPFEGTITWTMTMPMMGDEEAHPMIINVKGHKEETETDMGAMGSAKAYKNSDSSKMYMVMGKRGYVIDVAAKTADVQNQLDSVDFYSTGKTETIAGHPAQEYILKGLKGMDQMSMWVASGFPKSIQESLSHSLSSSPNQDPKVAKAMSELVNKGLVPVRIVIQKDGEDAVKMEFVKYEEKSLDDALFVPPADIHFMPMPQMGGGGMN